MFASWKDSSGVNEHIHHLSYLPFYWGVQLSSILGKFKLHNTVLSTTVTMLYIISSDLIYLITEGLYGELICLYFAYPTAPCNYFSTVFTSLIYIF